jgi:hypothetical protein
VGHESSSLGLWSLPYATSQEIPHLPHVSCETSPFFASPVDERNAPREKCGSRIASTHTRCAFSDADRPAKRRQQSRKQLRRFRRARSDLDPVYFGTWRVRSSLEPKPRLLVSRSVHSKLPPPSHRNDSASLFIISSRCDARFLSRSQCVLISHRGVGRSVASSMHELRRSSPCLSRKGQSRVSQVMKVKICSAHLKSRLRPRLLKNNVLGDESYLRET